MKRRDKYNGRRKTPLFFSVSFRLVLIVAAMAMGLSYISVFTDPSVFSFPMFFGLFFIPIAIINFILLIAALVKRSRSAWIPLIVLLPFLLFADSFFRIGNDSKDEGTEYKGSLKIESYNVGMFSSANPERERENCRRQIAGHLEKEGAAIVCLQEFYAADYLQADTIFSRQYPYRHYKLFRTRDGHLFGNIILSRWKIAGSGSMTFPASTNLSIFADIDIGHDTLRIYNNHLESYNISFTSIIKKLTDSQKEIQEKMKGTTIKRSDQVNTILENIGHSRHPVIICGDFNDTPLSYAYHRLSKGRKDSFKEAGKGFAATFAPLWPLLRIDYILFPKEFSGISHHTPRINLSDHYPVIAETGYND